MVDSLMVIGISLGIIIFGFIFMAANSYEESSDSNARKYNRTIKISRWICGVLGASAISCTIMSAVFASTMNHSESACHRAISNAEYKDGTCYQVYNIKITVDKK